MKTIPLTGGGEALVDDAEYESLNRHKWHTIASQSGVRYVSRMTLIDGKWRRILMHREVARAAATVHIDHINRNTFDNQRQNLRECTRSQNSGNMPAHGTSGFKGVRRSTTASRPLWLARICGKHLGSFATPEQAARAYDDAAREVFGEFARLNFPHPGEQGCREVM